MIMVMTSSSSCACISIPVDVLSPAENQETCDGITQVDQTSELQCPCSQSNSKLNKTRQGQHLLFTADKE